MLNFFSKKPSKQMQQDYIAQANKVVKCFLYANKYNYFPPKDGFSSAPINEAKSSKDIVSGICDLIDNYGLNKISHSREFSEFNSLVITIAELTEKTTDMHEHAACLIISLTNIIEKIADDYYKHFPKYRPMLEMLDNIAKITMPIFYTLFREDMPLQFRHAFPRTSQMFEGYRAAFF